jgi:hypothetical protein
MLLFGWRFDRVDLAEKAPHHCAGFTPMAPASII